MNISQHTPITNNPSFPPAQLHRSFMLWESRGLTKVKQLIHTSSWKPKSFNELQLEYQLPDSHYIHFHQIMSYWKQCKLPPHQIFASSFLDQVASSRRYAISHLYPKLQMLFLKSIDSSLVAQWLKDFPEIQSVEELLTGYAAIARTTPSEVWRETQFKILHRAYSTYLHPATNSTTTFVSEERVICPKCYRQSPLLAHSL